MTSLNMRAIQTVTVGAGGAASISFTSIPQTYTDLFIYVSARTDRSSAIDNLNIQYNGNYSNVQTRELYGTGSAVGSGSDPSGQYTGYINGNNATANSFGVTYLYIPNYTLSINKSSNSDGTSENNATTAYQAMSANLWSNTAAITSITLAPYLGNTLLQYSTATLYGVISAAQGAKATGGMIFQDSTHIYHAFLSSGTFTPTQSLSIDSICIAGGGGGGKAGGGGGAGSLIYNTGMSVTATNYTVTIGAGGGGATSRGTNGTNGSATTFNGTSATGGGGGASNSVNNGSAGGSGGGAVNNASTGGSANAGTLNGGTGYVNVGGNGNNSLGAGGGGSGQAGQQSISPIGGIGGNGTTAFSSWGLATNTGQVFANTYYYAGGGGGYSDNVATGGYGGGGASGVGTNNGSAGTANTGGGGGASRDAGAGDGGAGGSGLVIIRYAK